MQSRRLGRTGLKVSQLCLGTMQWGWTTDEENAVQVMDAFVEAGGNFIDTADVYSRWARNNPGGVAEQIIGRWMKERGNRRQLVIATKVRGPMWDGPNGEGLSRKHIVGAVEDSLRRLQTDYIDLYQSHAFDETTPIEETMAAFDQLVQQGKVLYVGCSNYPAWRLAKALWASDVNDLVRYESLQPHYNLAHRAEFERELMPLCEAEEVGVIPYSPLAAGFLTGKYERDNVPESARAAGIRQRYFDAAGWRTLDAVRRVAAEVDSTPAGVSLAWLLAQPVVTAPIIGANTVEQLQDSLPALDVALSDEQVTRLNEASRWAEA